jgi:hypothetical protein
MRRVSDLVHPAASLTSIVLALLPMVPIRCRNRTGLGGRARLGRSIHRGPCASVDVVLDRLDGVRQVAAGRWRARCPAHDGKNRNVLSIAECGDGTVLLKCFQGCPVCDVVRAVGLELTDLFPPADWQANGTHHVRPTGRPRTDWPAIIAACERDLILVKIVLEQVGRREPINDVDAVACQAAATRMLVLMTKARNG